MKNKDPAALREQAIAATRAVAAARRLWLGGGPRSAAARYFRLTLKAEKLMLRLVTADPDSVEVRLAYGRVVGGRAESLVGNRFALRRQVVTAARSTLWGLYGTEFAGGKPDRMGAILQASPVENNFGLPDDQHSVDDGSSRLALAAQTRFFLAECLLSFGTGGSDRYVTPDELNAIALSGPASTTELELGVKKCQLASCRGYDNPDEARLLANEAMAAYQLLAEAGQGYGPDDVADAEARRDTIFRGFP